MKIVTSHGGGGMVQVNVSKWHMGEGGPNWTKNVSHIIIWSLTSYCDLFRIDNLFVTNLHLWAFSNHNVAVGLI